MVDSANQIVAAIETAENAVAAAEQRKAQVEKEIEDLRRQVPSFQAVAEKERALVTELRNQNKALKDSLAAELRLLRDQIVEARRELVEIDAQKKAAMADVSDLQARREAEQKTLTHVQRSLETFVPPRT
jgi:chromosome segregation ATPase